MSGPTEHGHLQIKPHSLGSVLVLEAAGDVDLATEHLLESAINDALGVGPVVLNLEEVPFFAISGLGALLRCRRSGLVHGHPLIIAAPQRQFEQLLNVAQLKSHLPCVRSVQTACALASHIDQARNPTVRATA